MEIKLTKEQYKRIVEMEGIPTNIKVLNEQFSRRGGYRMKSLDYGILSRQIDEARRGRVKLAGNTFLDRIDEHTVGILFHSTYIVKVDVTGTIEIDCGGWSGSNITRDRLDDTLNCEGIRFSRSDNVTYMHYKGEAYKFKDKTLILPNGDVILPE